LNTTFPSSAKTGRPPGGATLTNIGFGDFACVHVVLQALHGFACAHNMSQSLDFKRFGPVRRYQPDADTKNTT
jgi:hypothetical protein